MHIHTFEVSSKLKNDDYYIIQNDLKNKDKSLWKAQNNGMDYWGLSDKGILIYMRVIKKKQFYCYSIKYRISARRVIDNDNYVGLFDTYLYKKLRDKVNALLYSKSPNLPPLDECSLSRIDFCINAYLEDQEQVKAYIRTVKRANIPGKLEEYMEYDSQSKRTKPTKDDFTAYLKDYIAISIYNKYAEMKKARKKKQYFPKSEIEKAKNIVRIEIRCMKKKVYAIMQKYDIRTIAEFMRHADEIGSKLYEQYLPKMFGKGEICTLKRAKEKIDMSGFGHKKIEFMKEFVEDANKARSAWEMYRWYKQHYGVSKIKRILGLFEDIDTNYVTVTTRDDKLFFEIPTPMELYEEFKDVS